MNKFELAASFVSGRKIRVWAPVQQRYYFGIITSMSLESGFTAPMEPSRFIVDLKTGEEIVRLYIGDGNCFVLPK